MGLWEWFTSLFDKDTNTLDLGTYVGSLTSEIFYKELAIQACINLIANAVSRSEFITYEKGKEKRGDNYYLFNVEPNQNKSSSKFWRDVVHKLVYKNECLVIQHDNKFYVADNYTPEKFAFKENIYKDIVIEDFSLRNVYLESQVFHFELHDERIKAIVDGLYNSYSQLIAASQKHYKTNNAKRGTLEIPTSYPETPKAQEDLANLLNVRLKKFYESEGGAVLPISNGMKYEELQSNVTSKGSIEGRDIRAFVDDIFDFIAIAFQVPPQLLKGNVADLEKTVNNFITFCINPIAELLTDEINRKYYGKKLFLERTYVKLDTTRIKAVDITDIAGALDILFRIGSYTVDDCLKQLGMEPLDNDWSKTRFVTKNYAPIENVISGNTT